MFPLGREHHDADLVLGNFGGNQLLANGLERIQGPGLVLAHQARITDHISSKYGGQAAFHSSSLLARRLEAKVGAIHAALKD
jgi:hypothetical protein